MMIVPVKMNGCQKKKEEGLGYSSSTDSEAEATEKVDYDEEVKDVPPGRAQGQKKKQKFLEDQRQPVSWGLASLFRRV